MKSRFHSELLKMGARFHVSQTGCSCNNRYVFSNTDAMTLKVLKENGNLHRKCRNRGDHSCPVKWEVVKDGIVTAKIYEPNLPDWDNVLLFFRKNNFSVEQW